MSAGVERERVLSPVYTI